VTACINDLPWLLDAAHPGTIRASVPTGPVVLVVDPARHDVPDDALAERIASMIVDAHNDRLARLAGGLHQ